MVGVKQWNEYYRTKHTNIMKNIFRLLFASIALVAVVGCETDGTENTSGGVKALPTPQATVNVTENNILLAWEAIDFAIYYEVSLNGGEAARTETPVYRYEKLDYNAEYTISIVAISADQTKYLNSEPQVLNVAIGEYDAPQYREWYAIAPATAVSNNGRWAVGGFDKNAVIIDLSNNRAQDVMNFEFYDVADNGVAVGSRFRGADDGGTAIYYKDGEYFDVELGDLPGNLYCSALTSVTPDGTKASGWFYDFVDNTYYTTLFGLVVPFVYDIVNDRITVLQPDEIYQQYRGGTQCTAISPEGVIIGLEQSGLGMFGVMWADEYAEWEYIYMQTDENHAPIESFGGVGTTLLSANARYVYGEGVREDSKEELAAAYNLETEEILWFPAFTNGSVTAMTDDGIAFFNDVPYGYGTTSFVIDTNKDMETSYTLVEWLKAEHNIDLTEYIQEGIIMIGTSADGRTLVGMTSTMSGYLSFAINLDGKRVVE